jgi:hypothetical protein
MADSESYFNLLQSALLQRGSQIATFALSLAELSTEESGSCLEPNPEDHSDIQFLNYEGDRANSAISATSCKDDAQETSPPLGEPARVAAGHIRSTIHSPELRTETILGPSLSFPSIPISFPSSEPRGAENPPPATPTQTRRDAHSALGATGLPQKDSPLTPPKPTPFKLKHPGKAAEDPGRQSACSFPDWQSEAVSALSLANSPDRPSDKCRSPARQSSNCSPPRRSTQGSPSRRTPTQGSPVKQPSSRAPSHPRDAPRDAPNDQGKPRSSQAGPASAELTQPTQEELGSPRMATSQGRPAGGVVIRLYGRPKKPC